MPGLAKLPDVVGFFSYSRDDDRDSKGRLSKLRDAIQRELGSQLGADKKHFRLWQDKEAIALGTLWESKIKDAIDKALFFIPIVTPRAVGSRHCKFEFELFLARERALDRDDLVFPILYIAVPALDDEEEWRSDPVLSIIGKRQYVDWREYRFMDVELAAFSQEIARFCDKIIIALRKPWVSPEERRRQEEAAALRRAEEERMRQEAETRKRAEEEARRREEEAEAKRLADEERIQREAEAKKREEEEARRRQAEADAQSRAEEAKRRRKEDAEAARRAEEERSAKEADEAEPAAALKRKERQAADATELRPLGEEAEAAASVKEREGAEAASQPGEANPERLRGLGAAQSANLKNWRLIVAVAGAAIAGAILLWVTEFGPRQASPPIPHPTVTAPSPPEETAQPKQPAKSTTSESSLTRAQERALKPGDTFKECADCPEMIVAPAGTFLMGSPAGEGFDDERPQHKVTIAQPFAIAKYEATFAEWDACAARGGCRTDVSDMGWGRGQRPVINVSWDDAQAYVKWFSGVTGRTYRLLSEAEYEYAARAGSQTKYAWGDEIELHGKPMANCSGCGSQWDNKQTAPVGSFPANVFELYDMVGNVFGVDGGLLESQLPGRALQRLGMDERRLQSPRRPRRVLGRRSRRPPLGAPPRELLRRPERLPGFPGHQDAYPLILDIFTLLGSRGEAPG